jgi:hypothetical protein
MAQVDEIIIEVEVNAGESSERLAAIQARINAVKQANKELKVEQKAINEELRINGTLTHEQATRLKDISAEMAKNTADLKELTAAEKMYTAQLNIATQGDRKFGDSLVELSAQLAQLKQEYRGLTAAQRESAEGKAMLKNIQDLDKALKEADGAMGDFQRNVGNYQSALLGLNGNVMKISQLFAGGFKQSLKAAGQAVKSFGKMLLTTPVGWIAAAVGALVKIFEKLKEAFNSSDDAGTALSEAMAKLKPIITAVKTVFVALAETVAKVVGGITSAASAIIGFLVPSFKEASKAAAELVTAEDKLQDQQRAYTLASAERSKQIAELKKQERADETLTFQEREKIFQKIDELEKKDLAERVAIAKENARIIEERYNQEVNTSDEAKDRIAEARAAVMRAETEYLTGTTRIAARAANARKQEAAEAEAAARKQEEARRKAHDAWMKQQQEKEKALQVEQAEMRKLEDLQAEAIDNELERQRVTTSQQYDRQIQDLNKRLETEKTLTVDARKAINQQIILLEEAKQRELAKIDETELKAQQESIAKMSEEAAKAAAEASKKAAEATAAEQQKIRDDYEKTALGLANGFQERLNAIYGNAAEQSRIEAERTAQYYRSLIDMDTQTKAALFESEEAYKTAVLDAESEMLAAREKSAETLQAQAKEVADTMQAVTGALSDLYEAAAGDSETYEKFKKAMAIVDATISMAQAIAAATSVSTAGDPYTLAIRIAANVAAVTAQFAAVIKAIKAASVPSAPAFEKGGIVGGTSYTGDRITAKVNSREMVLTLDQQQHLFDLITKGIPAARIDYDRMAAAFANAVAAMPAPVLDYKEFTTFVRRVNMENNKVKQL